MGRLLKEMPTLDVEEAMNLAVNAHNSAIGPNGFSPFQWTRGQSMDPEFPVGLNPSKAFGGVLKLKMKAKAAYEAESARIKLSRLNNTVGRPMSVYKAGELAMLWRQRVKPGKTSGSWVGPLRVLLQEGTTVWLATGASLVKAKLNQLRPVTKREELNASLEGTAVYRLPVTMETLLKEFFTGKHFTDATGEVPSEIQKQEDLTPTEVMVQPSNRPRTDTWRVEKSCLIRIHNTPRLALFVPGRLGGCPVPETRLTGKRTTIVRPLVAHSEEVTLEDDFLQDGSRNLQERWTGETRFDILQNNGRSQLQQVSRGRVMKFLEQRLTMTTLRSRRIVLAHLRNPLLHLQPKWWLVEQFCRQCQRLWLIVFDRSSAIRRSESSGRSPSA